MGNPMVVGRLVSEDGTTTAVYVPLEQGANGKVVADQIRDILGRERAGDLQYFVAGDPVARDTFGAEMFRQMAMFAPVAGLVMLIALQFMFRSLALSLSIMAVAMAASVWSMGLLVAVGQPVHIMSSMMPVFLMAIATDSIHIFNEFYFRLREVPDRRRAVLETIAAVGAPVRYTALATAAGFGVLVIGGIVPVRVFGLFTAFGTLVIRLMSFSFIPAVMMQARTASAGLVAARRWTPALPLARVARRAERPPASGRAAPPLWRSSAFRESGSTTIWCAGSSRPATCASPTPSSTNSSAARRYCIWWSPARVKTPSRIRRRSATWKRSNAISIRRTWLGKPAPSWTSSSASTG
jgi:uncharacterized membrane protein YdfJ with MMPL/SSD domain